MQIPVSLTTVLVMCIDLSAKLLRATSFAYENVVDRVGVWVRDNTYCCFEPSFGGAFVITTVGDRLRSNSFSLRARWLVIKVVGKWRCEPHALSIGHTGLYVQRGARTKPGAKPFIVPAAIASLDLRLLRPGASCPEQALL